MILIQGFSKRTPIFPQGYIFPPPWGGAKYEVLGVREKTDYKPKQKRKRKGKEGKKRKEKKEKGKKKEKMVFG